MRSAVAIWPPRALQATVARSADAIVKSDTRRVDRPRRIASECINRVPLDPARRRRLLDRSALDPLRDELGVLPLQPRVQTRGDADDGLVLIERELVEDLAALEMTRLALLVQERRDVGSEGDRLRL